MSLPRTPRHGAETEVGVGLENTYASGPAITEGTAVCRLVVDKVNIARNPNVYEAPASFGSLQPVAAERIVNLSGSAATFTLSGPYNNRTIGIFLGACLQTGTWTESTFTGPFTFFDGGSHPQFSTDQYSYTLYQKTVDTGEDNYVSGVVGPNMTISGEAGSKIMFSTEGQGKDAGSIDQTLSGTWQTSGSNAEGYALRNFEDCAFTLNVGSGDTSISLNSFEVNFGYSEVTSVKPDGDGANEAKLFGRPQGTFTINLLKDATAQATLAKEANGNVITFKITGGLTLTATAQIDAHELVQDGLLKCNVSGPLYASDNTSDMLSITP